MPGVYPSYCGLKLLRAFFYSPLNGMLVHRWVHRQQYFHIRGKKKCHDRVRSPTPNFRNGALCHGHRKNVPSSSFCWEGVITVQYLITEIPSGDLCHFPDHGIWPVGEMLSLSQCHHKNNLIHVKQDSFKC